MSLQMRNNCLIAVAMTLCMSCVNNSDSIYYEKSIKDWKVYTKALGTDHLLLENTILLVLKGSECSPSIAELHWWDNFRLQNSELNVQLVILEKYATSFQAFLDYEEIQIPALRDSSGILFDHDLLPGTPMKLFIDKKGKVKKIAPIGANIDPEQDSFVAGLKL